MNKVAGLPPTYKVEEAAERVNRHIDGHKTLVFLGGYGAYRDWSNYIRPIFKQHNPNLGFTYALNQDDQKVHGIRPILSPPPGSGTNQYHELLFETSVKEKDSPSLLGQLVFLLLNTEGTIWTCATQDYWGRVHFPIEHEYARSGIPYSGPKLLLLENRRKVRQFIREQELTRESKERAERIFYDLDAYLEGRIGQLIDSPQNNLVKMLV